MLTTWSNNCFVKGRPDGTQIFRTILKCSERYNYLAFFQVSLKLYKRHWTLWNKILSFFQLNVYSFSLEEGGVFFIKSQKLSGSTSSFTAEQATLFQTFRMKRSVQKDIFITTLAELLLGTTQLCFVRLHCLCFNPVDLSSLHITVVLSVTQFVAIKRF